MRKVQVRVEITHFPEMQFVLSRGVSSRQVSAKPYHEELIVWAPGVLVTERHYGGGAAGLTELDALANFRYHAAFLNNCHLREIELIDEEGKVI